MSKKIQFCINGEKREIYVEENQILLDIIRNDLGLTATKNGCGNGECGACTIIMDGKAVKSCLILAIEADGRTIQTVEGLSKDGKLNPLQEAFLEAGAIQCGFCTPGMLMSATALLNENKEPSAEEIKEVLAGNICRCTGYIKIIEAIQSVNK
ncbi:MAG TPA: (2Fe-2S)-binding protein [Oscillospiraceae bacterium]|nr:(2Fe-2S)-binding protein [Oscillospiraceae bacterium]